MGQKLGKLFYGDRHDDLELSLLILLSVYVYGFDCTRSAIRRAAARPCSI
jgi:hypothetical protein